jgi:hypothetical protein
MKRPQLSIRDLLISTLLAGLSLLILIPFYGGQFPPLITSLLVSRFGWFLAGASVGKLFHRAILVGIVVGTLSFCFDHLLPSHGYKEPLPQPHSKSDP